MSVPYSSDLDPSDFLFHIYSLLGRLLLGPLLHNEQIYYKNPCDFVLHLNILYYFDMFFVIIDILVKLISFFLLQNSEDPPYNFKAMLRKTNYNRPDSNTMNYDFNSNNQQQQSFQTPKLRPTGRSFEENTQYGGANKLGTRGQKQTSSSFDERGNSYADASADNSEVTFTGDAFDI